MGLGVRSWTPSIDSDFLCPTAPTEVPSREGGGCGYRCGAGLNGLRGELVALLFCKRLARFLAELDRTMLCFSASMPRMLGMVGDRGGGVGGMSPVRETRVSMPALRSLRAARGETL